MPAQWGGPVKRPTIDELLDQQAIGMLARIYALGIDLYDRELCRSAFAADAVAANQEGELIPIDDYLSVLHESFAAAESLQHLIGQQHIRVAEDEAEMWSYGLGVRNARVVSGQLYRDICRRGEEGWTIVERRLHVQWYEPDSA